MSAGIAQVQGAAAQPLDLAGDGVAVARLGPEHGEDERRQVPIGEFAPHICLLFLGVFML